MIEWLSPQLGMSERVRHTFGALEGRRFPLVGTRYSNHAFHVVLWPRRRMVCVTDRAIIVVAMEWRSGPMTVLARLSRDRLIGPLTENWTTVRTLGQRLHVHRRFFDVVRAADYELWESQPSWTYDEVLALQRWEWGMPSVEASGDFSTRRL